MNTCTITKEIKKPKRIANPSLLLQRVMLEIDTIFSGFYEHYGATSNDFELFMQKNLPGTAKKITDFEQMVDTDIYDRFKKKRLSYKSFSAWQKSLHSWRDALVSALRYFELDQFGEDMVMRFHNN